MFFLPTALYPVENCPQSRDTTESLEEQCIQQAACLRVGAIHMYLDQSTSIYGPIFETMADNDVLDLFCRNMELFDEAVSENLLYLRELGCNDERAMLDKVAQESVMTPTSGFWNRSRSFLHSIYNVVCTRGQNEVRPYDDLMPHIKDFARTGALSAVLLDPGICSLLHLSTDIGYVNLCTDSRIVPTSTL